MNESKVCGEFYEAKALDFLTSQGLRLVDRNFNCKVGELDLIMLENDALIFVEVRYRTASSYGSATESITESKKKKIKGAAKFFLLQNPEFQHHSCRIDVIAIDNGKISWIKNAFY